MCIENKGVRRLARRHFFGESKSSLKVELRFKVSWGFFVPLNRRQIQIQPKVLFSTKSSSC